MPSYNAEAFIADSLESVLKQTYPHWELLVTDDCSTDHTAEIVLSYAAQDPRIKLTVAETHAGIASTRNQSLLRAQGRYVAFLDNDDLWVPEKLEKLLARIDRDYSELHEEERGECLVVDSGNSTYRIPYLTTVAAAVASAQGIRAARDSQGGVKSIQAYHADIR